jgi:hypothetical protein
MGLQIIGDSNHRSRSEKSGRSETRASASCIAQPTGATANDIGADDRQAAGDQIIATRLRRRSCRPDLWAEQR